jgi:transposase, IS5 family
VCALLSSKLDEIAYFFAPILQDSQYAVLEGNADEKAQLPPSVDHHRQQFGHPPAVLAGDRGLHSARNERYARATGIPEVVLPKPGRKSARRIAYEQQAWFQAGRNWRAGIEGRISGPAAASTATGAWNAG